MKSLIFLQIISPWHRRSFWALLRRSHLGPEHTMLLTQFLPTHANPRAATRVLTWALKKRMNLPCQVTCTCLQKSVWSPWMILWPLCRITLLFLLSCKNMGQFEQIPEKGGREFLRAVGRGWYTELCHCRSCGFAAGCHLWRSPCASFPRLWISHGVGLWLESVP